MPAIQHLAALRHAYPADRLGEAVCETTRTRSFSHDEIRCVFRKIVDAEYNMLTRSRCVKH